MNERDLYNPFEQMNLDPGACFLCGGVPDESTREHVFPMWLLRRQGLLDSTLTLLNGTLVPHRQLTVPCCRECNSEHLSRLESVIERATAEGVEALRALPEDLVFQWIAKIFIGILWAELRFKADRAEIDGGPIVEPDTMAEYAVLHGHLQSSRRPFIFETPTPWSLFITGLHSFEPNLDFDYHDDVIRLAFGIRFSGVGIIACLQDNCTQRELYGELWEPFADTPLHWVQWDELWARVVYRNALLNRVPKYINMLPSSDDEPVHVVSLRTGGFAPDSMWDEWDFETYAHIVLSFMRHKAPSLRLEDIFTPPDKVATWLYRDDGELNRLDSDGNRIE